MGDVLESIVLLSLNNSYCMIIPRQFQKQFVPTLFSSLPISLLS
jgi:hypothetical protein